MNEKRYYKLKKNNELDYDTQKLIGTILDDGVINSVIYIL